VPAASSPGVTGPAYREFLRRLEGTRTLGVSLGLERMATALERLGGPQREVPAVHIAGTNGKGSTAAMLEAIFRAAGRHTGLFTSPHLARFTERIRLDGQEIDGDHLASLGEQVFATGVPLTYFEVATALGFLAMAQARVEVAVLEVGLGGRLDATNLCVPVATAITSIGFDHTELLGDTIAAIAAEKAGIAKPGVPLYLAPVDPVARAEIARICDDVGAPLVDVPLPALGELPALGLSGAHQRSNAALAVALARRVAAVEGWDFDEAALAAGLAAVEWPGRLEEVTPGIWLDAAHNLDGARALAASLPPARPRALVISVVRGKAVAEMLATLAPGFDFIFATQSSSPRALPPDDLVALLDAQARDRARALPDPRAALAAARATVGPVGSVVVAGSIFLVGELRALLHGDAVDPIVTGDPMR
jgi:dihydrofolate synthase/folylpolyglutamate synthase